MIVRHMMTESVITCSPEQTMHEAARLMWEHDCGCLPVVDHEKHVIGVLTDRDICMAAYTQGRPLGEVRVENAMSRNLILCNPKTSLAEVERLMRDHQIRRIPVVDTQGKLVGIVGLADVARYASGTLRRKLAAPGVAKTLRAIVEPRRPLSAAAE